MDQNCSEGRVLLFLRQKEVTFLSRSKSSIKICSILCLGTSWTWPPFQDLFCIMHAPTQDFSTNILVLMFVQTFWFGIKTYLQTILIKRKVCWQIFVFQSKTFVQTFWFQRKTFPQTFWFRIKRLYCKKKWFKSKAFVQTFWFDQRKTFPQQKFLVCCKAFVQTVWIKSKIFPHKYLYFKARVSFRHFGFQARLLLKLYSKEFHLNMLVSLQDLCSHILWIKSLV